MKKKFLTRIQIFNLITGKETEAADSLFEEIFGENDRYDDFVKFCEDVKHNTKVKKLAFK